MDERYTLDPFLNDSAWECFTFRTVRLPKCAASLFTNPTCTMHRLAVLRVQRLSLAKSLLSSDHNHCCKLGAEGRAMALAKSWCALASSLITKGSDVSASRITPTVHSIDHILLARNSIESYFDVCDCNDGGCTRGGICLSNRHENDLVHDHFGSWDTFGACHQRIGWLFTSVALRMSTGFVPDDECVQRRQAKLENRRVLKIERRLSTEARSDGARLCSRWTPSTPGKSQRAVCQHRRARLLAKQRRFLQRVSAETQACATARRCQRLASLPTLVGQRLRAHALRWRTAQSWRSKVFRRRPTACKENNEPNQVSGFVRDRAVLHGFAIYPHFIAGGHASAFVAELPRAARNGKRTDV